METGIFTGLADYLPEPLVVLSPDGTVFGVNRGFTGVYGWASSELAGTSLAGILGYPFGDVEPYLRRCAGTREMLPGTILLRTRTGELRSCRCEGCLLEPAHGESTARVLLRLLNQQTSVARFTALTQRLGDLTAEIRRRRQAEEQAAAAYAELMEGQQRLAVLAEAPNALLASLDPGAIQRAMIDITHRLLPADAHAIWRYEETGRWTVVEQRGLSENFVTEVSGWTGVADGGVPFTQPLPVPDVSGSPLLAGRQPIYRAEGVRSLLVIPLTIDRRQHGTIVAYFRQRREFAEAEVRTATALGSICSSVLTTVELYRREAATRAAAEVAARRARFLAQASAALGSSLDYEHTLQVVADLAVPEIADWCAVELSEPDGIRQVAVAHVDPAKLDLARRMLEAYPEDPSSPISVPSVVRSGQPVLMQLTDEMFVQGARSPEHLEMLRTLGLRSVMRVPLSGHGRTLGVLTMASAESRAEYTAADLDFAESVGSRAALAVENALAYQEARRANRLKDEFLATLSHELRTPLNAIVGYSRLLQSDAMPAARRGHALQAVERNAFALTQIVEDVLDVSKIVAGKIRLNVQPVDLEPVLRDALTTMAPAADAKGVRVQTIVDPDAPRVSGDPDRLQQIVWNLLSNAVKFTPRGGSIQLRLERVQSHVQIVVSDTGIGIPADFLPQVFERFRQADSRFARQYGGLGLGLSIAKQLVELHGGSITAESAGPDRGATFRVRLPVLVVHSGEQADASPAPSASIQPPAGSPVSVRLEDIHVLIVDDEPDALELMVDILGAAGATVETATSAVLALQALEAKPPDVLLSDIGMPEMDGFELISRLRQSPNAAIRGIPAAALTAYARSEDRVRALQTGFQLHLAKPISPAELVAAVRALTAANL